MKKGLMRLWAVGLLGLMGGMGAEASSRGQVVGQVRLESGLPVVGAQVLVFDVRDLRRGVLAAGTTDAAGEFVLALGGLRQAQTPVGFALGPNYPNPFNPSTVIPYELASGGYVRLEVFNLLGQRVAMLVDGEQGAGAHRAVWMATDGVGRAVSAGVYLYRLTVDGQQQVGRMVLVDGGAGLGRASASSVESLSPRRSQSTLRAEPVEARPEAGDASYGLVVLGEGLVPYLDVDFRVGSGPVGIEMAVVDLGRGKAVQTDDQWLLGDVDRDGRITFFDAVLVMFHAFSPSVPLTVESAIALGDVDGDGRVTVDDAWLIATYVVDPSDPAVASVRIGQPIDASGMMVVGETRSFSLPVAEGYDPVSMEFLWIPPGKFQMGSPSTELGCTDDNDNLIHCSDEGPVHEVEISRGFWLGKYEVTQGEWWSVMRNSPSRDGISYRRKPVESVSWDDVQEFIGKLNAADSGGYRLPSEAEWEYACRAGKQTRWSLGNEDGNDESLLHKYILIVRDLPSTKAVGGKLPNRWGLYDMHSNVSEWVQDWYGENYYNSSPRVDPQGPTSGSRRVFRGGSNRGYLRNTRSAWRGHRRLGDRSHTIGVRLVRIHSP